MTEENNQEKAARLAARRAAWNQYRTHCPQCAEPVSGNLATLRPGSTRLYCPHCQAWMGYGPWPPEG